MWGVEVVGGLVHVHWNLGHCDWLQLIACMCVGVGVCKNKANFLEVARQTADTWAGCSGVWMSASLDVLFLVIFHQAWNISGLNKAPTAVWLLACCSAYGRTRLVYTRRRRERKRGREGGRKRLTSRCIVLAVCTDIWTLKGQCVRFVKNLKNELKLKLKQLDCSPSLSL